MDDRYAIKNVLKFTKGPIWTATWVSTLACYTHTHRLLSIILPLQVTTSGEVIYLGELYY